MALGNLSKKEWREARDLQEKARGQLDDLKALLEPTEVKSKAKLDAYLKDLSAAYKPLHANVVELSSLFSAHYETQNDLYQEKLDSSETWGDSERASRIDSWVSALETLANIEELPADFTFDMESVSYELPGTADDIFGNDSEYGSLPTSFPTKVDLSSAADLNTIESLLDDAEALDDSGEKAF